MGVSKYRRPAPQAGHGVNRFHAELSFLFCESDGALGLKSNLGAQLDRAYLGQEHLDQSHEPNIRVVSLLRKIVDKFSRLSVKQQKVLEIWYTQLQLDPGEIEVREAHRAYLGVGT